MRAYEFYTTPKDGVISIPEQLRARITSSIKVIILEELHDAPNYEDINAKRKSDLLLPPTLDTSEWKFSREEANER